MEADKLGRLYCKGWRQMIEDKVVADISSWVRQTKYIRKKKMLKTKTRKESVTEELRTRNEGFLDGLLLWWTKSSNSYTCDQFTREQAEKLVKDLNSAYLYALHRRTREIKKW
jgi:uncharacterized membrane protein YdbT with pleckstrin-like domain